MNKTILHEPLPYQAKQMQKDLLIDILRHELSVKDKRIDKAIEYINELIADTKGMLNDMKYQDKEETITRFVEDLKTDIKHYEHLEDILRGEDNEE
jgi:hypothetical protein